MADSEFILLLADDDVLYPGHLQASVEALERFASAASRTRPSSFIDAESNASSQGPVRDRGDLTIERGEDAQAHDAPRLAVVLLVGPLSDVSHPCCREAFQEAGRLADLRLWLRIASNWDLAYIREALVGFRVHEGSISAGTARAKGLASGSDEFFRLILRTVDEQRNLFLDEASLDPGLRSELRSLTKLRS